MAESSINVTIQKLLQSEVANDAKVFAVRPMNYPAGNAVAINRVFHETDGRNVHDVVVATIYANSVDEMETIGSQVLASLRDDPDGNEWSFGKAIDVQFVATGSDTTGWDGAREQFLRSIEFEVSW